MISELITNEKNLPIQYDESKSPTNADKIEYPYPDIKLAERPTRLILTLQKYEY